MGGRGSMPAALGFDYRSLPERGAETKAAAAAGREGGMRALVFGILTLAAWSAFGQSAYPHRQVTMVIPTTVGTAADITARNFAPKLAQKFGRAFVVDNRTGASGNIAVS